MTSRKPVDSEAPPTECEGWIGAAVVRGPETTGTNIADPIAFHIFRAANEGALFAVTDSQDPSKLPTLPNNGEWIFFKWFTETGQERIGLSETEAKADIEKQGYHLSRVRIEVRERLDAGD